MIPGYTHGHEPVGMGKYTPAELALTSCRFCGKTIQKFTSLAQEYQCEIEQLSKKARRNGEQQS